MAPKKTKPIKSKTSENKHLDVTPSKKCKIKKKAEDSAREAVSATSLQLDVTPPKEYKVERKAEEAISGAKKARLQKLKVDKSTTIGESQATRECVLSDSLGIETSLQGNLCAVKSGMEVKAFLDGIMPPDAPVGHVVYRKLKVGKNCRGQPVVLIKYISPSSKLPRGRPPAEAYEHLQICVNKCGGSEEAALRLSRLCSLKLEQGALLGAVCALRKEWYQKFKSVDFSSIFVMTACATLPCPPAASAPADLACQAIAATSQGLQPASNCSLDTSVTNSPRKNMVEKDSCLCDFIDLAVPESQQNVSKMSASPCDGGTLHPGAEILQTSRKSSGDLFDDGMALISNDSADSQKYPQILISQSSLHREDHASSIEFSQSHQVSPRSPNTPSKEAEKDELLVDFTVSSPAQESQRELISGADKGCASPQTRIKSSGDLFDDGMMLALISRGRRASCTESPRQKDADRDESFVDFGVPPAPESHGDLIKAAEETLAMLRKGNAPQMTSRSSLRRRDVSHVGAKTMQSSTAKARAVRIPEFRARSETAERSDGVKGSSHPMKRLHPAEPGALGRKRRRAKCSLIEASPSDKGRSDLEVTARCNTFVEGVLKVAPSPTEVEPGNVGDVQQVGACSRKDGSYDDRGVVFKRPVSGGSKKGGIYARSPFFTRARERLKRKSAEEEWRKEWRKFMRSANSLACEGISVAAPTVQSSFPRDNGTSLQASLEALKRLQSRSCPHVALDSISLAQRFASMVVTWPGYRPSNSGEASDEQDPSTMLVKLAMLAAIPPLLELAVDNPGREIELNAKEILLQQLEGDPSFVANYVKENADADVAHDLQELESATQQGVHLSEKLLQFKIRAEKDVHLAKVRASIAFMRGREALLMATKNAATRWVYAELTWRSGVFTKEAMPSAACAAAMGETQFSAVTSTYASPELMRSRLEVCRCFLPDSEMLNLKELALQQHCLDFAMGLSAESGAIANQEGDGSQSSGSSFDCASSQRDEYSQELRAMAATGVVQTLAEMALAQWRQTKNNCESRNLLLLAAREDAILKVASNADGECTQMLQGDETNLQALRSLLERVSDKRVHDEVLRELKLDVKKQAEEQLRMACERVAAAEDELERCSAATAAWENLAEAAVSRSQSAKVPMLIGKPKSSDALSAWKNLSENDWARLDDGRHLNDALVDFFTNFLANHLGGPRVHAFSSHFFLQLTSRGAENGIQGWENVRTWTRGVRKLQKRGIFDHDYLILPVNVDSTHWMLVIVCYHAKAGSCASEKLPEIEPAIVPPQMPVILFLDSLETSVSTQGRLLSFLRGYLSSEWKDCIGGDFDSEAIQGIQVDVPRQNNSYDCGVFVLEFVAQLLRHPDGLKSIAEPIPRHSLLVHTEPRHRWRRAAEILRVDGEVGVTRALAEICDDFPISEAPSIHDQGNSDIEEVTQLNPICPFAVSESRPQRHRSLQAFSSSRH